MDHTNYSRWILVHIRDMKSHSSAVKQELKHYWVLNSTSRKFSSIPIDQQNNQQVKGLGGTVGLTENPVVLRRWMLSGDY